MKFFALGPAKSRTNNIFQHIEEVLPAQYIVLKVEKRKRAGIGSWKAMYMKILSLKQWRRRHG